MDNTAIVHALAERRTRQYLARLDRIAPGRVVGLYVVGSAAMGAFRPDHSDVDLVVVLDGREHGDCQLIASIHRRSAPREFLASFLHTRPSISGVCNAVFVARQDLTRPVRSIVPIGSHVGLEHHCGAAFDVNPVIWQTFADHGIAVRGPAPSTLGLDPEPEALRRWNLDNLQSYWEPFARSLATGSLALRHRIRPRWTTAWGTLGPVRLHRTITTGEIVSKERAGEHALEVFDAAWHPIIREGLAARRGERRTAAFADHAAALRRTGEFGLHVVERAEAIGS